MSGICTPEERGTKSVWWMKTNERKSRRREMKRNKEERKRTGKDFLWKRKKRKKWGRRKQHLSVRKRKGKEEGSFIAGETTTLTSFMCATLCEIASGVETMRHYAFWGGSIQCVVHWIPFGAPNSCPWSHSPETSRQVLEKSLERRKVVDALTCKSNGRRFKQRS